MKSLFTISLLFLSLFAEADSWTQKANFPGTPRGDAFYFSIGNFGYIGVGADANWNFLSDIWQYDAVNNIWTQKAIFADTARFQGSAFSIGSKGYFGMGSSGIGLYNDFWEYDPSSDTWTQKATLPAQKRSASIGFAIGKKGYIGTGYGCSPVPCAETNHNDFWEYDQSSNSWTQKASIPTNGRGFAYGLSIGLKGYIGGGEDDSGHVYNDFWEYDPVTDTWIQKANYPGGQRNDIDGAHFTIGNFGYIGTGCYPSPTYSFDDFWRYDPSTDSWSQIPSLPTQSRVGAIGFSINNKGYIGTGFWVSNLLNTLNDLWEYTPDSTTGINELSSSTFQFQVSPNPAHEELVISHWSLVGDNKVEITIFDAVGRKVFSQQSEIKNPKSEIINVSDFSEGLYFIVADDGRERAVKKFVKE